MRISFLILLLMALGESLMAQAPADVVAPEDAGYSALYAKRAIPVVTGRLLNLTAEESKRIVVSYSVETPFTGIPMMRPAKVSPDGRFSLALDYPFPYQQVFLVVGDVFSATVVADRDLFVELDMKKMRTAKRVYNYGEGVRYRGADGAMNTFITRYSSYREQERKPLYSRIMTLYMSQQSIDSLVPAYDRVFDSLKQIQDAYIAANPSRYGWILENERLTQYYFELCNHFVGKKMDDELWNKISRHKGYLISNNSGNFYSALTHYAMFLPGGEKLSDAKTRLVRDIRRADSLYPPGRADLVKLRLGTMRLELEEQDTGLAAILPSLNSQWSIAVAATEHGQRVSQLAAIGKTLAASAGTTDYPGLGKPLFETAFGARMYKATGTTAADLLATLKQSFPGKAIIIDRWATWCAPCISEMINSKELETESKDLPVVFVYLCSLRNSSEEKWKSKVVELQQPGVHILIDVPLDEELSQQFSFHGYPGYAFLDRSGTFRPGAFQWMAEINSRETLAALVNK